MSLLGPSEEFVFRNADKIIRLDSRPNDSSANLNMNLSFSYLETTFFCRTLVFSLCVI